MRKKDIIKLMTIFIGVFAIVAILCVGMKKSKPDESLVTIEVRNNHIVQARRRFNDDVTAEDQKAIDAFNKKFANKEDKAA